MRQIKHLRRGGKQQEEKLAAGAPLKLGIQKSLGGYERYEGGAVVRNSHMWGGDRSN